MGQLYWKKELNSLIEEADSRMISHIANTGEEKNKRVAVMSNDIDLVLYNSGLKRWGIKQIWLCFGTKEKRDIPIYLMVEIFGEVRNLASPLFRGCDVTSRLRTKAAARKANLVLYLKHFGEKPLSKGV